jgi:formate/nitrite transporter FocA (FNT family)
MTDESRLERSVLDPYSPGQIAVMIEDVGVAKARLPALQTVTLGLLAGAFIAFGAMFIRW